MEKPSFLENETATKILGRLGLKAKLPYNTLRRVLFVISITWFPLFIMSLMQGDAINPDITIPFLYDFETYTRFLIAIPFLFIAEKFINFQTSNSLVHFVKSGTISENNVNAYEALINKYRKIQESGIINLVILIIALVSIYSFKKLLGDLGDSSSWKVNSENSVTPAGYWYVFFCLPVYQYMSFRLLFKFFLWAWFLWKVSRMKLNLVATDPDGAGGLSFLGIAQGMFGILGFAQAASFSSEIANRVIYGGHRVEDYYMTILSVPFIVIIYIFPLFFFTRKLIRLKLTSLMEFGVLTHIYSSQFEKKWVQSKDQTDEQLLGSGDIQSLADIGTSFKVIEDMRTVPCSYRIPLFMLLMTGLPFIPLITLKIPLLELVKGILGFLL